MNNVFMLIVLTQKDMLAVVLNVQFIKNKKKVTLRPTLTVSFLRGFHGKLWLAF